MYACLLRVTWITTNHPKLSDTGNSEDAYQALCSAMKEESVSIPQEQIDNLIRGVDGRAEACKLANGMHPKY
jgi:hypothetical protein